MLLIMTYTNEKTKGDVRLDWKETKNRNAPYKTIHRLPRDAGAGQSGRREIQVEDTRVSIGERRSLSRRQKIACLDAPLISSLATKCDASAYNPLPGFDKL